MSVEPGVVVVVVVIISSDMHLLPDIAAASVIVQVKNTCTFELFILWN